MAQYYGVVRSGQELSHFGIKGMKWGIRKERPQSNRRSISKLRAVMKILAAQRKDRKLHDTTGRYGKGNIDLNHRKVVHNKDGSISTERSFSMKFNGKETLLPTVINGKIVSENAAIDHYLRTGEHLGQFSSVKKANEYAKQLHNRQDWYYNRRKQYR